MLGRHRKPVAEAPAFDVQTAVANCRTAIRRIGRAMDLCDQQEVAGWQHQAVQCQRVNELAEMRIRIQQDRLAARGEALR